MTLETGLTRMLGIRHPIFSAPMGPDLSGAELVAAVSEAGGLGMLQQQLATLDALREAIRAVREQTDAPFAVNFLLPFVQEAQVDLCLEERVPVLSFFWGDAAPWVERAHRGGAKVMHQVGSVEAARRAVDSGVDIVIAQGVEAGGHVEGQVSTLALVPRVVDEITPVPVAAAGGIADGRGIVAALALGAEACVLGTAFLATAECRAHALYKQKILEARETDTVKTTLFGHGWPDAPHRCLRTSFVDTWIEDEARGNASRSDEPVIGEALIAGRSIPLQRFVGFPPNFEATGEIESMSLLAGQSVGLVSELLTAAELVRRLVAEATARAQLISETAR